MYDNVRVGAGKMVTFGNFSAGVRHHKTSDCRLWEDMGFFDFPNSSITFEAVLYEADGSIQFNYGSLSGEGASGESVTVGIENANGTDGAEYSCFASRDRA